MSTPVLHLQQNTAQKEPQHAVGDAHRGKDWNADRDGLAVGMTLLEDETGAERVRARAVRLREGVRVYEVHEADDWCALVAAHPRSVTYSRRHDWWRATGWDGAWVLPDWASVARQWDRVHLSVRGYLTVSGRLLEPGVPGAGAVHGAGGLGVRRGPARTLLAGWSPAQTYWLTDVVEAVGPPVQWQAAGDHPLRWQPTKPQASQG